MLVKFIGLSYLLLKYRFQHPTDRMGHVRSRPSSNDLHQGTLAYLPSSFHLIILSQVHAMFGRTLMLAGLTRIIEVCYFVPAISDQEDYTDEHTLAGGSMNMKKAAARSWRHLMPFVSGFYR